MVHPPLRLLLPILLTGACLAPVGAMAQKTPTQPPIPTPTQAPADKPAAAASPTAEPQKLNGAAPAWTVTCVSPGRAVAANCAMEQRLFAKESGNLVSVVVVSVPGATRQPILWLQLPTGLALQESMTLTIDAEAPRPLAVQSCDERSCTISLPVAPDLLAAMKKGRVMTVRAVSAKREPLAFPHALTDFAASYDAIQ